MAVITLQVDTSQAQNALRAVNQAITQAKINGASISLDGRNVTNQLKTIADTGKNAGNVLQKTTTDTQKKTIQSIKAVTKEFKAGAGMIKSFASGIVSWWTLVILAIEGATKTFTYFFNNLTESIPKLNQRMQNLNNQVKKNYQSWQNEKKAADQFKVSLKDLAEKQSLTNTEQVVAQALIDKLNQKYKGLNLTIDDTTKKVKNYSAALTEMNRQDVEQQQKLLRAQISAKREQVDAKLAETFGTGKVTLANADVDKMFTNAENWFGDINSLQRQQMALQWNNGGLDDKLKILNDLATRYSNNQTILKTINGAISALEELKKLQGQYNELIDATNIRLANGQKLLEEQQKAQQKIVDLNSDTDKTLASIAEDQEKTWFNSLDTEQQKIQFLQGKLKTLQQQEREAQAEINKLESQDSNVAAISSVSDSLQGQIKSVTSDVDELNDKIAKAKREFEKKTGNPLRLNVKQLEQEVADAQSILNTNNKNDNGIIGALIDTGVRTKAQNKLASSSQQLKVAKQVLGLQSKLTQKQQDKATLTKALTQNEEKYAEAVKNSLIDQQTLAAAKNKQAKLQKQIYDNTKQQGKLTEDISKRELKELEERQKAEQKAAEAAAELAEKRKQTNRQFFQSGKDSLAQQYLKLIGKQREALILEQKINLARALGLKSIKELNAAQVKGIERQVDLQMKLEELSNMNSINVDSPNIITNELARKGGFASSVVVERNNVNKQILNASQQQVSIQNAIKSEIQKYGVIS